MRSFLRTAAALLAIAALLASLTVLRSPRREIPGLGGRERVLLRIWITGSPGGAQSWLTEQLRLWEKQQPGVMTHLRLVTPEEAFAPDAVLPDLILCMPGDFTDPGVLFSPQEAGSGIRQPLLQAGLWEGRQYALPLCWGAWVMAIDSTLDPVPAASPAPTTLLGRPAATAVPESPPGYPLEAALASGCPLQAPAGAALDALRLLLPPESRPPLTQDFAQLTSAEVYDAFLNRRCASCMLTGGQVAALSSLVSAGRGFPFRLLVPERVFTDQLWLACLTPQAPQEAAALLSFLTGEEAQKALSSQGLHTVRDDVTLYASGFSAEIEAAGQRSLTAQSAFVSLREAQDAAWRRFQEAPGE